MVTLPSPLSTGLPFATRQLEARGRSSTEGARVVASKAPRGLGGHTGKGSGEGAQPLPRNFFWTFEWKMARFGAFWVLFMQTAVA